MSRRGPAGTPAALGYRMPAEWEPHAATWLAWPHERRDWPGKFEAIRWVYADVVRHLVSGERVRILVEDAAIERQARRVLGRAHVDLARVDFVRLRTDRSWTRDSLPIFVRRDDADLALVDWKFNGWAKYANWRRDDALGERLARRLRRRRWTPTADGRRVVLEGGAIDVNGRGTLLATEECLLGAEQARNPGLSRPDLERVLGEHLNVRKVLWLGEGIVGDDTHGHVDDLARFVDPQTVVIATTDDASDANHARLQANHARLAAMTDQDGAPLRVVPLPMPAAVHFDGQRLPASYANFYIGNEVVLVPTFNDPADRTALTILASLMPSRRVLGIHALDLVWGLGTLHCMTQPEPVGRPVRASRA